MDPIIGGVGGGLYGLFKYLLHDKPQEDKDRKIRAAQQLYSAWSKLPVDQQIRSADLLGNIMQGGLSGAAFGQQFENNQNALDRQSVGASTAKFTPYSLPTATVPRYSLMPEAYGDNSLGFFVLGN